MFFRDFGKVVQTLTQFTTFSVPMIYPFTFVSQRFGETIANHYYLLNPMAEAVLLMQRGFWVGSTTDREATIAHHLPDDRRACTGCGDVDPAMHVATGLADQHLVAIVEQSVHAHRDEL